MTSLTPIKIIDPHLHLFNLDAGDYQWLKIENPPHWQDKSLIARNITEAELALRQPLTLAGFVHIEAGFDNEQPWREIQWLTSHCSLPFTAVASINLTLPSNVFEQQILALKKYSCVVGVRDILDEEAVALLSTGQVQNNLAILAQHQLSFDLQMPLGNLTAVDALTKIMTRDTKLKVIINHAGCPPYLDNQTIDQSIPWHNWSQGLAILAQFQQCSIKCSGFELSKRGYANHWRESVIKLCIDLFGIDRTMLASNFPLCLFQESYQHYWQDLVQQQQLNADDINSLCYLNAKKTYKL